MTLKHTRSKLPAARFRTGSLLMGTFLVMILALGTATAATGSGSAVSSARASIASSTVDGVVRQAVTTSTEGECAYLDRYMAPFPLAVDDWPTTMVGAPPGDGPGEIEPREVGPTACDIVNDQSIENRDGVPYRRVTIGVSGTVFGYIPDDRGGFNEPGGSRDHEFAPHFFIAAAADQMGPFRPGVGHYNYSSATPAGAEVLLPENAEDWNGRLWIIAHGGSYYSGLSLPSREPGVFNRYLNRGNFAGALIDEGYAVAWTRRAASTSLPPSGAREHIELDDGSCRGGPQSECGLDRGITMSNHTDLLRDFTVISRNFVTEQLGSAPEGVFWRGHSAGGAPGRTYNMVPGMNVDHDGERLFDGIYASETAGGRGTPDWFIEGEVDEDGVVNLELSDEDHLPFDEDHRANLAPVIETYHGAYAGPRTVSIPRLYERFPTTYIENKRTLARVTVEKGLQDMWRFYEIADVSHGDAAGFATSWPEMAAEMVDIGGVSMALKPALDAWATQGVEPPDSRINARDVRELDASFGPRIELPESACPRGVFREYLPNHRGSTQTSSALFVPYLTEIRPSLNADTQPIPDGYDPDWLEPLDGRDYLVDMTGSNTRMTRPTIEQGWKLRYRSGLHERGILHPYDSLTRATYVKCIMGVAKDLHDDGLLSTEAFEWYLGKALSDELMTDSAPLSKDDCKGGGWQAMGFDNQGHCIKYVQTGELD